MLLQNIILCVVISCCNTVHNDVYVLQLLTFVSAVEICSHAFKALDNRGDKLLIKDLKNLVYTAAGKIQFGQFITLFQRTLFKLDNVLLVHIED